MKMSRILILLTLSLSLSLWAGQPATHKPDTTITIVVNPIANLAPLFNVITIFNPTPTPISVYIPFEPTSHITPNPAKLRYSSNVNFLYDLKPASHSPNSFDLFTFHSLTAVVPNTPLTFGLIARYNNTDSHSKEGYYGISLGAMFSLTPHTHTVYWHIQYSAARRYGVPNPYNVQVVETGVDIRIHKILYLSINLPIEEYVTSTEFYPMVGLSLIMR